MSRAHEHEAILRDIASKLPVVPNARKRKIWIGCFIVGAVAFVYLLATNPERAWGAWAINTLLFLGMAMGGVVLAAAIRLSNGRWGGPIQRIGELLGAYMPMGIATMAVLLVAGIWSYLPWTKTVEPRQAPYLNVPFLYARTLGGLLLFWWLARRTLRVSLRGDLKLLAPHVAAELKPEYERLTAGWRGDGAEEDWQRHELAHLSPQLALTFVVFYTVMAWDFIMSLTPSWISGLFGWWVYASAFLTAVAMVAFLATQFRTKYRLEAYITPDHFWDTGKIVFSFAIFWVYAFFSQYLPIWYANMPEETWWVFIRLEEPWRPLGLAAFCMIFLIPFLGMMNKAAKSSGLWLGLFSLLIISGVWLERHVLVMPSLEPAQVWVGLPEIGVTIGFLGLFGWMVHSAVSKYPVVRVVDVLARHGGHGH